MADFIKLVALKDTINAGKTPEFTRDKAEAFIQLNYSGNFKCLHAELRSHQRVFMTDRLHSTVEFSQYLVSISFTAKSITKNNGGIIAPTP